MSHRLRCLNPCSLVAGAIWGLMEPLGGAVLLEKACYWGQAFRVYSLAPCPVCFLHFMPGVEKMIF